MEIQSILINSKRRFIQNLKMNLKRKQILTLKLSMKNKIQKTQIGLITKKKKKYEIKINYNKEFNNSRKC